MGERRARVHYATMAAVYSPNLLVKARRGAHLVWIVPRGVPFMTVSVRGGLVGAALLSLLGRFQRRQWQRYASPG